jgi:hypothetical protein
MPKQRERLLMSAVSAASFYDPRVQKVLESRRTALRGWPVFVHRRIDHLVRKLDGINAVESLRFEDIYRKDSSFASELFRVLEDYHHKSPFTYSLKRVLLEQYWRWISLGDSSHKENRPLDYNEIAFLSRSLMGRTVQELSLRNEASNLRREIRMIDARWKLHTRRIEDLERLVLKKHPKRLPKNDEGRSKLKEIEKEIRSTLESYFFVNDLYAQNLVD